MPAVVTPCPGKAVRKDAAFQIFAKGLAHKGLWRVVVSLASQTGPRWPAQARSRNARQWFGTAAGVRGGGGVELGFGCCCWLGCSKRSVARWVVRMGSAAAWQRVLPTIRARPVGKGLIRWAIDVDPLAI